MDTKKTVSDLLDTGITQQKLAEMVPCSQSLISALLNGDRGTRLSFKIGLRLSELHKEKCTVASAT